MKVHIVYRSTGSENRKRRPPYYSKVLCLLSFLRSVEGCPDREIVFLNDGDIPGERLGLMESSGEIVQLPALEERGKLSTRAGLYRSYVSALELEEAREWSEADLLYLAEDDYLYRPDAFSCLLAAAEQLPQASYFAFYGSIVWHRTRGFWVEDQLWHMAESTASTFAARIGDLRSDLLIHKLAFNVGHDTEVCLTYQGVRPYRWSYIAGDFLGGEPGRSRPFVARAKTAAYQVAANLLALKAAFRRHILVVSQPPLATHMELPYLGQGVDWEDVATDTVRWAEERGLGKSLLT